MKDQHLENIDIADLGGKQSRLPLRRKMWLRTVSAFGIGAVLHDRPHNLAILVGGSQEIVLDRFKGSLESERGVSKRGQLPPTHADAEVQRGALTGIVRILTSVRGSQPSLRCAFRHARSRSGQRVIIRPGILTSAGQVHAAA